MAGSSASLHESRDDLAASTVDRHRAIISLMEELEAVDWYDQRAEAAEDDALRAIMEHNRDEEKEHAAMVLEWLRRHDPALDAQLRTYLFSDGDILATEQGIDGSTGGGDVAAGDGSLGIGSLRENHS